MDHLFHRPLNSASVPTTKLGVRSFLRFVRFLMFAVSGGADHTWGRLCAGLPTAERQTTNNSEALALLRNHRCCGQSPRIRREWLRIPLSHEESHEAAGSRVLVLFPNICGTWQI